MKANENEGYSGNDKDDFSECTEKGFSGYSGYSGVINADKITPWAGKPKRDIIIFKEFTPIFFSQYLRDCNEDVMNKAKTFQEIKKAKELERGKPFGSSEADKREIAELRMKGDTSNKGYLKLPFGRGNITGDSFMKYIPERKIAIGTTRETIQGIRKLEGESKHNYEVFEALYDLIYRHVISEFESEGETYRHFRRYRFDRIRLNKDDIFRRLKWDSTNDWNKDKLKNALYFLSNVRFLLLFLNGDRPTNKPLNLSPFILNFAELENGDIIFDANSIYFLQVEKHIERKLNEIENPKQMNLFGKGEMPRYLPELPRVQGESPECRALKNYLKAKSIEIGVKKWDEPVIELAKRIYDVSRGRKSVWRGVDKLSKTLDELKKEGFIKDYFPRIDKGYGMAKKKISLKIS